MVYLIAGLCIFLGVHSVRIVADGWRTQMLQRAGEGAHVDDVGAGVGIDGDPGDAGQGQNSGTAGETGPAIHAEGASRRREGDGPGSGLGHRQGVAVAMRVRDGDGRSRGRHRV